MGGSYRFRGLSRNNFASPEGYEHASKASPAFRIFQAATESALGEKLHSHRRVSLAPCGPRGERMMPAG